MLRDERHETSCSATRRLRAATTALAAHSSHPKRAAATVCMSADAVVGELLADRYGAIFGGGGRMLAADPTVAAARRQLDDRALCQLPEFLSTAGLSALRAEAVEKLLPLASRVKVREDKGTAYSGDAMAVEAGHPRTVLHTTRANFLPYNEIPQTSLLRRLYESPELEALVSELLGERMYRCVDTYRFANSKPPVPLNHIGEHRPMIHRPALSAGALTSLSWSPAAATAFTVSSPLSLPAACDHRCC